MAAHTLMIIVVSQKHTASDMEVTWISAKRYLSTRLHGVYLFWVSSVALTALQTLHELLYIAGMAWKGFVNGLMLPN
jgi:hypothetical protein